MANMANEPDYLSVEEARVLLGVSHTTMARVLSDGTLAWEPNPLDRRGKIVKRADVLALLAKQPRKMPGKEAAAA